MRVFKLLVPIYSVLLILATVRGQDLEVDADDDGKVEVVEENEPEEHVAEFAYETPKYNADQFNFIDHFDDLEASKNRWIQSQAKKDDIAEELAKYDGKWEWEAPQRIGLKRDMGLVLKSKAKHAAIAAPLSKVFTFKDEKPLVVQYEVTMQDGQECGGSYIKLLSAGKETEDLSKFNDKTPYTIMFGPDKCGNDIKMHFIFRHVNPINGSITEKHCRKPKDRLEDPFRDKLPHLYQLVVRPDNTYEIRVDDKIVNEGSLLTDFTPPVNPSREIDDPQDVKPKDWDEREKIPDPTATKPADWDDDAPPQIPDPNSVKPEGWLDDEPEMIPDPTVQKPDDWDVEIDGEWEAPLVDNPVCEKAVGCGVWKAALIQNENYKGKWRAPLIDNPNYQGKWAPKKIPNPDYYEDLAPFEMTPISAVGIEIWSMSSDILFDNLVITDDVDVAKDFAAKTFELKRKFIAKESKTLWHRLMRHMNYKPGWWALYFLYLLIPASCYVYYLYRRAKEETLWKKVITYSNENPWVWRACTVLAGTITVFTLYRLFSKSPKKDSGDDAKKTDAVQPDDEDEDVTAAAAPSPADDKSSNNAGKTSPKKKKKSDLDVKSPDAAKVDVAGDREEEALDEDDEAEETTTKSSAPRKRRVRKDES